MESTKVCMNCRVALASGELKKGWPMLSGDLASLCDKCGTAYEQSSFCEAFHTGDPGWCNCKLCGKALHCGCIVSRFMIKFLDSGGVTCISCPKKSSQFFMNVSQESNGRDLPSFASAEHVGSVLERTNQKDLLHIQRISPTQSSLRMEQEESLLPSRLDALRDKTERKELQKLSAQPNLSISLGPTLVNKAPKSTATQMFKGSSESNLNMVSNNLNPGCGDINRSNREKSEDMEKDNLFPQSSLTSARKRVRNSGTNRKRLLTDSVDVLELQIDWDDEQNIMRPPEYVKPSIFTLEDQEFEEYDERPVFGKKTIFVSRQNGEVEQLVQCDACGKWRRLSVNTLIPQKWSCSDNLLDPARKMRSSCSAPDELSPREQDKLVRQMKEFKRRKLASSNEKLHQAQEASAVDTLANAGISTTGEQGEIAVAATTKHPRHQAGCSCIVCSQPPSGIGKQNQACTCSVCGPAWRRFKKELMERKLNRGEPGQASQQALSESRDETGVESIPAVESAAGGNIDLNTEQGSSSSAQEQDKDTSGAHEPV